jgi:hypothetical protein
MDGVRDASVAHPPSESPRARGLQERRMAAVVARQQEELGTLSAAGLARKIGQPPSAPAAAHALTPYAAQSVCLFGVGCMFECLSV